MSQNVQHCLRGFLELVSNGVTVANRSRTDVWRADRSSVRLQVPSVLHVLLASEEEFLDAADLPGLCQLLQVAAPTVAAITDDYMQHPLHVAAATSGLGRARTVSLLLTAYPDAVTAIDDQGRLPLHWASILADETSEALQVLKTLIATHPAGASVRDYRGRLPLHWAADAQQPKVALAVEMLLKVAVGASQVTDEYGRLPLHLAVENVRHNAAAAPAVQMLLDVFPAGAAVKDSPGRLPIDFLRGHVDRSCVAAVKCVREMLDECES